MSIIHGIDTSQYGYRFRSRTEARWAVFWETLRIEWRYELRGVWQDEHGGYLPDFLLAVPGIGPIWTEIKPFLFQSGGSAPSFTMDVQRTIAMMTQLCHMPIKKLDVGACPGIVFGDDPSPRPRGILVWPTEESARTLFAQLARCPFCAALCFFVEVTRPFDRYAVCCRCVFPFTKVRLSTAEATRYLEDSAFAEAARIARGTRFDKRESAVTHHPRSNPVGAHGEANTLAKLTVDDVRAIRVRFQAGERLQTIALSFRVDKSTISRVARGDTWAHVP